MNPHQKIPQSQSGAVLIIVLIVLLLVSILGVMVFKRSTTDLRVATASQISQLMFQANDSAFGKVEKEDRLLATSTSRGALDTLQGFITRPGQQHVGAEVVFCVRPKEDALFRLDKVTQKNAAGSVLTGASNGFCDPTNANDYVNEGRVMTQMTFMKTNEMKGDCPLCGHSRNDSSNDLTTSAGYDEPPCTYFKGYSVSLVPSYTSGNVDLGSSTSTGRTTVAGCLKEKIDTMDKCLTDLGVPHNIQVQSYKHEPAGAKCII
ncbi:MULTISPECIES: PilX N-terminal domain-containing pilus assembly protein [unclassified Moraxella]|uniref:PilX N-terminal domain-containing pilus assembly protein n=1 Tax=unclassified Moraxella TaxID=2685852 RepID=UPI003AF552A2